MHVKATLMGVAVLVVTAGGLAGAGGMGVAAAASPTPIDTCSTISEPGAYVLANDIQYDGISRCITIEASDVTLDGDGHRLIGTGRGYGITVRPDRPVYGGFELSSNVTVTNLAVTDFFNGIWYLGVANGTISETNVTNTRNGIQLQRTSEDSTVYPTRGITVTSNQVTGSNTGIVVAGSVDNTVTGNTLTDNEVWGIRLYQASSITVEDNLATRNGRAGIRLSESDGNDITANTVNENDEYGIRLDQSHDNTLTDNVVNANTDRYGAGIYLAESHDNTLSRNTATANVGWAVSLSDSNGNRLTGNDLYENEEIGVVVIGDSNTLENNVVRDNKGGVGVGLIGVDNTLTGNTVTGANGPGILFHGTGNTLAENEIHDNGGSGINMGGLGQDADSNVLTGNTVNSNYYGIFLSQGNNNTFTDNVAKDNREWNFLSRETDADVSVSGLTVAAETTISFDGRAIGFRPVESPPDDPPGIGTTGAYVDAVGTSDDSWLRLTVHYTAARLDGRDETTLRLGHYDDNDTWTAVPGSEVDTVGNTVSGTITDFGVLGLLVDLVTPSIELDLPTAVNEGDPVTASVSISDPDSSTWTASVDYGDGSDVESLSLSTRRLTLDHRYDDDGEYSVTIDLCDDRDQCSVVTRSVTVRNVAPEVEIDVTSGGPNDPVTVTASITDPGLADTHTAEIAWGDGTVETAIVSASSGAGTVTASHTYANLGSYAITVRVSDGDGGVGSATTTLEIEPHRPTETPTASATPSKTASMTAQTTPTTTPMATATVTTTTGQPGFGVGIAIVGVVLAAIRFVRCS